MVKNKNQKEENNDYLTKQIISYLGNKRKILKNIEKMVIKVCKKLKKNKLVCGDLFAGSGVVSRLLKKYSSKLIVNDIEYYSKIINECFLTNKSKFDKIKFDKYLKEINMYLNNTHTHTHTHTHTQGYPKQIILKNYSPVAQRFFFTKKNAEYIDNFRWCIDKFIPKEYQKFFISLLLYEASVHTNTCGVFKGFYKNKNGKGQFGGEGRFSLKRIKKNISIKEPPFLSNFETKNKIYNQNANELIKKKQIKFDFVYLDPPYNEHPYGSNYFMLNVIAKNVEPENISKISGIPKDWKRSDYNKKHKAFNSLKELIDNLDTKFFLLSYSNEGLIDIKKIEKISNKFKIIDKKRIKYSSFKASRNYKKRRKYVNEFLFLFEKK